MASTDKVELVENEELPATQEDHDMPSWEKGNGYIPEASGNFNNNKTEEENEVPQSQTTVPVYTHGTSGPSLSHNAAVVMNPLDGSCRIVSSETEENTTVRPIKERDLKFLNGFAIVAILLFLPTGIAALVYAIRASKAYYDGISVGDLTSARKYIKVCERLIILSVVLGLLTYVLLFALLEKQHLSEHRINHGYSMHG